MNDETQPKRKFVARNGNGETTSPPCDRPVDAHNAGIERFGTGNFIVFEVYGMDLKIPLKDGVTVAVKARVKAQARVKVANAGTMDSKVKMPEEEVKNALERALKDAMKVVKSMDVVEKIMVKDAGGDAEAAVIEVKEIEVFEEIEVDENIKVVVKKGNDQGL